MKTKKFCEELQKFYTDRGWHGGTLAMVDFDNINSITIFSSYFGKNTKTNIELFNWHNNKDKKYEKWFLELSDNIMKKHKIKKSQIRFFY